MGIGQAVAEDVGADGGEGDGREVRLDEAVIDGGEIEAAEVFVGQAGPAAGEDGGDVGVERFGERGVDQSRGRETAVVGL